MIGDRQLAKLVKFFTDAPSSKYTPEDISITFGEARIRYTPASDDFDATGNVDRAVYGKLMLDAATLAAGTLVENKFVTNESFNTYAMKPYQEGQLSAVARLIHAQKDKYTVEVRLLDNDGRPVASGYGSFSLAKTSIIDPDEENQDESPEEDNEWVAFASVWRSPFGMIHQN